MNAHELHNLLLPIRDGLKSLGVWPEGYRYHQLTGWERWNGFAYKPCEVTDAINAFTVSIVNYFAIVVGRIRITDRSGHVYAHTKKHHTGRGQNLLTALVNLFESYEGEMF